MANPLDFPCPRCHAAAGQKCKNYLGKGKFICKERLNPPAPPSPNEPEPDTGAGESPAPSLFDWEETP